MFDTDLTVEAKAIYSYMCSYTGAGKTAFPKVTTILKHLHISKNTYYKHFKLLLQKKYVIVKKIKGYRNRNSYVLNNNPTQIKTLECDTKSKSYLSLDGINANGYGFVPKLIMLDDRLSIKAKALIAFLYTLVQSGKSVYPHRSTIYTLLNIGKDAYYVAYNQLIKYNYITVYQQRDSLGQFTVNNIVINTNPTTNNSPCPDFEEHSKNRENTINSIEKPDTEILENSNNSGVGNSDKFQCSFVCDNINSTNNNNSNNRVLSNLKVYSDVEKNDEDLKERIYNLSWYNYYKNYRKNNIDENYAKKYCAVVNTLVLLLTEKDYVFFNKNYVKLNIFMEYLNNCVEEDIDGDNSIRDLIFSIVNHFEMCCKKYNILNKNAYLKALICDDVMQYTLSDENDYAKDTSDNTAIYPLERLKRIIA